MCSVHTLPKPNNVLHSSILLINYNKQYNYFKLLFPVYNPLTMILHCDYFQLLVLKFLYIFIRPLFYIFLLDNCFIYFHHQLFYNAPVAASIPNVFYYSLDGTVTMVMTHFYLKSWLRFLLEIHRFLLVSLHYELLVHFSQQDEVFSICWLVSQSEVEPFPCKILGAS